MTTTTHTSAVLTAQEATIATAHVDIQRLRVGQRQVTMGMFRQLCYRSIVHWWDMPHAEADGWGDEGAVFRLHGVATAGPHDA